MFRKIVLTALCAILVVSVGAALTAQEKKMKPGIYAVFDTSEGTFTALLFDKETPITVENFVGLAEGTKSWIDPRTGAKRVNKPYYDGLIFHRIIDNFMIQGGDPTGTGSGGPGYKFADEFSPKLKFTKVGQLAMANSGPSTNGSQFFVTLAATDWLNNKHTIFGEVVDGLDVVKKIGKVAVDKASNRPLTPVVMKKVTIKRVTAE